MTRKAEMYLHEALRRWLNWGENKPFDLAWTGLGTKNQYKELLDEGLMQWVNDEAPAPYCSGWLHLTPYGVEQLRKLLWSKLIKDYELRLP
jgi:hypothetical protein